MKSWNVVIKIMKKLNCRPCLARGARFFYGQATTGRKALTRRQRFSRKGDLATFFLYGFLLSGCAVTPIAFRRVETYQFQTDKGLLTVNVAGIYRVNRELAKRREKNGEVLENEVYGFYVPSEKTIWTTAYPSTIMHELRHFFEGEFHD